MLTADQLQRYEADGYLVLPAFLSDEEVDSLESARARLVQEMDPSEHQVSIFSTHEDRLQNLHAKDEYFIHSGDKVRFFWEEEAFDAAGNLKVDRSLAINKIGHALHWLVPEFKRVTFSEKVQSVYRSLKFSAPLVVQSMYIFKQPGIGGEVTPHQDASFLYTDPLKGAGLWLALEDADLENACLWLAPGSHHAGLGRRFVRTSDATGPPLVYRGPPPALDDAEYAPVPVQRGGCVLINGLVQHRSYANRSTRSRHIYAFHVVESDGAEYAKDNWLQPSEQLPFPNLYQ